MTDTMITLERIDELLAFLPVLSDPNSDLEPGWADYEYVIHPARKRLDDTDFIAACSMGELRTMLTACVRGERFSDGFWAHCLQSGVMLRLLLRLAELRDSFGR